MMSNADTHSLLMRMSVGGSVVGMARAYFLVRAVGDAEECLQVELSGRPKLSSNSSRIVRLIVCVNEPGFICSADGSTSGDSCPSKTKFVLAIWLRLS
jgi:hypothetical protein